MLNTEIAQIIIISSRYTFYDYIGAIICCSHCNKRREYGYRMQCLRMCKTSPYKLHPLHSTFVHETHPGKWQNKFAQRNTNQENSPVQNPAEEDDSAIQKESDFLERPSEDFFCPVTFELLLNSHQTICCGNYLSEKAVHRLQHDRKPCPMCKEPQIATVQDKFHRQSERSASPMSSHTSLGARP